MSGSLLATCARLHSPQRAPCRRDYRAALAWGAVSEAIEQLTRFDPRAGRRSGSTGAPVGRYVLLDVFTDSPLEGNQLAVFTDARGIGVQDMQRLARELRLSETVFALPAQADGDIAIRIFTPQCELPFAGHPVLGTAVLLGNALSREEARLETGVGVVDVRLRREEGRVVSGWMRQPVPSWTSYEREPELLRALGVPARGCRSRCTTTARATCTSSSPTRPA
jgi:predicted PhzF superfamily epimerase YddE/YHI9